MPLAAPSRLQLGGVGLKSVHGFYAGRADRPCKRGHEPPHVQRLAAWREQQGGVLLVVPGVASAERARWLVHNVKVVKPRACIAFTHKRCGEDHALDQLLDLTAASPVAAACEIVRASNSPPPNTTAALTEAEGGSPETGMRSRQHQGAGYVAQLKRLPPMLVEMGRFEFVFVVLDDVVLHPGSFNMSAMLELARFHRLSFASPAVRGGWPFMRPWAGIAQPSQFAVGRIVSRIEIFAMLATPGAWRCWYELLDPGTNAVGWGYDHWLATFCGGWSSMNYSAGIIDQQVADHQIDTAVVKLGRTYSTKLAYNAMYEMAQDWISRGVRLDRNLVSQLLGVLCNPAHHPSCDAEKAQKVSHMKVSSPHKGVRAGSGQGAGCLQSFCRPPCKPLTLFDVVDYRMLGVAIVGNVSIATAKMGQLGPNRETGKRPARKEWKNEVLRVTVAAQENFWVNLLTVLGQAAWAYAHGLKHTIVVQRRSAGAYLSPQESSGSRWELLFEQPTPPARIPFREHHFVQMDCRAAGHLYPTREEEYPQTIAMATAVRHMRAQQVWRWARVQQPILARANLIWKEDVLPRARGSRRAILGVHMGTADNALRPMPPPSAYVPFIKAFLNNNGPHSMIFLATDDAAFHALVLRTFGTERVIQRRDGRTLSGSADRAMGPTERSSEQVEVRRRGAEVLLDSLLLSRCTYLLKAASYVSEFAIYYNLRLMNHSFDLSIQDQPVPDWAASGGRRAKRVPRRSSKSSKLFHHADV